MLVWYTQSYSGSINKLTIGYQLDKGPQLESTEQHNINAKRLGSNTRGTKTTFVKKRTCMPNLEISCLEMLKKKIIQAVFACRSIIQIDSA